MRGGRGAIYDTFVIFQVVTPFYLPPELALLLDASLVLIMRSNPNPNEICPVLNGQLPVMRANPHGPQLANLFEVQ